MLYYCSENRYKFIGNEVKLDVSEFFFLILQRRDVVWKGGLFSKGGYQSENMNFSF